MKTLARSVATTAVIATVLLSIDFLCIRPLRCSTVAHTLEQSTMRLAQREGSVAVSLHARDNLKQARECLRVLPTDVSLYMIAAANCGLFGNYAAASDYYTQGLRYDRRPELFMSLANAQGRLGQRSEAIENLVRAYTFWPESGDEIEDPVVHDEVMRRITAYESDLRRRR